jgi:hypothetical protein
MLSDEEKKSLETALESGIKDTTKKALARLGLIACNPDDYYCSAPVSEEK